MILYSYYLTQRPAQPGAMPLEGLQPVNPGGDFGARTPIYYADPFPGGEHQLKLLCRAWGIVSYNRPLTIEEQTNYELVPAPIKKVIWANHRVIGYTYMTQEEADRVNAIHDVGIYVGSNREWTAQGTEAE